jgi:3-hydroxyisobutyrate dehydrogenase
VHSTISPAACRRLNAIAANQDVDLIDAPVSVGANLPKLLVMVGGAPKPVERCREALEAIGDPVVYLGPIGSGQIGKLINNTLVAATTALGAEAIELGHDLGLDETSVAAALAVGSSRGTWSSLLLRRRSTDDSAGPTFGWATKDVGHTLELAKEAGVDTNRDILNLAVRGAEVLNP